LGVTAIAGSIELSAEINAFLGFLFSARCVELESSNAFAQQLIA